MKESEEVRGPPSGWHGNRARSTLTSSVSLRRVLQPLQEPGFPPPILSPRERERLLHSEEVWAFRTPSTFVVFVPSRIRTGWNRAWLSDVLPTRKAPPICREAKRVHVVDAGTSSLFLFPLLFLFCFQRGCDSSAAYSRILSFRVFSPFCFFYVCRVFVSSRISLLLREGSMALWKTARSASTLTVVRKASATAEEAGVWITKLPNFSC